MPSAFVLINCQSRFIPDVIDSLRELPNLEDAQKTEGMYDVVAKLRSENQDDLRETNVRARRVSNIRSTLTMIIVEEERAKEELASEGDVQGYGLQHQQPLPSAIRDSTTA
jgi:nitrate reductase NapAB chaperone NapD